MTRRDLVSKVNKEGGFENINIVAYMIQILENTIVDALSKGETIKLNGFLQLGTKETSQRTGMFKGKEWVSEPKTMAYVKISPIVQQKIQDYQEEHNGMDWLDIFTSYPDEVQYEYVKEAKRKIELEKQKTQ